MHENSTQREPKKQKTNMHVRAPKEKTNLETGAWEKRWKRIKTGTGTKCRKWHT